jgi:hypothetical protein
MIYTTPGGGVNAIAIMVVQVMRGEGLPLTRPSFALCRLSSEFSRGYHIILPAASFTVVGLQMYETTGHKNTD